jgi:hypothetical protein
MDIAEIVILMLGVILGLALENTIQIAVLRYRFNLHLKLCGKSQLLEE